MLGIVACVVTLILLREKMIGSKDQSLSLGIRVGQLEKTINSQAETIRNLEARAAADHALLNVVSENQKAQSEILRSVMIGEKPNLKNLQR
jgi:hypothetical protein